MKIDENLQNSLTLANSTSITDAIYKKLIEIVFFAIIGNQEVQNVSNLCNSKPDLIKELYAALLSATAHFARQNANIEEIASCLTKQCSFNNAKVKQYCELYTQNIEDIEGALMNIGTHLPHLTDVSWKIDYIVKSSFLEAGQGPFFRIGLQTEKYDLETKCKKVEFVNFTCDGQEMQDLVYKLKDAVRHCQKIGNEH